MCKEPIIMYFYFTHLSSSNAGSLVPLASECLSAGCAYHRQPSQWDLDYFPQACGPLEHVHGFENLSACWVALVAVHPSPFG